ncbi:hypothetical protein D3C87_77520 [compost metagenome]
MNIGFIGYSYDNFDKGKAKKIIDEIFSDLKNTDIIISGATDKGIPGLVYHKAKSLNMKTVGITAEEAKEYTLFPVDELIFEGKHFGDESEKFISSLNVLYRIGGGDQSRQEVKMAKDMNLEVYEYKLTRLKIKDER